MRHIFLLILFLAIPVMANTYYVDTTGVEEDSLRDAINLAASNPGIDTIILRDGTYNLSSQLELIDSLVLMGENGYPACTLLASASSGNQYRPLYCSGKSNIEIKGLTITGGYADNGGGIYLGNVSDVKIDSCNIVRNKATTYGGGLYMENSSDTVTISNCMFQGDSAVPANGWGGGIYILSPTYVLIENTEIQKCYTYNHGSAVIASGGGQVDFINVMIQENTCLSGSSTLIISNSTHANIDRSVVVNNFATAYTSVYAVGTGTVANITRSIICGNIAESDVVGGIATNQSKMFVDSSFLVDNVSITSATTGLGMAVYSTDSLSINNSNVYFNTYQPDTEFTNSASYPQDFENNYWYITDSSEIAGLFSGPVDFYPFSTTQMPAGVPGEPSSITSLSVYSDSGMAQTADSLYSGNFYLKLEGTDLNPDLIDGATVILRSHANTHGIALLLLETGENTGIFTGTFRADSTAGSNARYDDAYNIIRYLSSGDTVWVISAKDTTEKIYLTKTYTGLSLKPEKTEMEIPFLSDIIKYAVAKSEDVKIEVIDITGRVVAIPVSGEVKPGHYTLRMDLPQGVYFVRMKARDYTATKKMVIVK